MSFNHNDNVSMIDACDIDPLPSRNRHVAEMNGDLKKDKVILPRSQVMEVIQHLISSSMTRGQYYCEVSRFYTNSFLTYRVNKKLVLKVSGDLDLDPMSPKGHSPTCLLYTSPSPRDRQKSRMPSSA